MGAKHVTHWIGGKPWTGAAARQGDIYDPATGQVAGVVDFASSSDVDDAVAAAKLAAQALEATKERGLLVGKGGLHGATLRMAPPLTITQDEAREGLGLLVDALQAVNTGAGA